VASDEGKNPMSRPRIVIADDHCLIQREIIDVLSGTCHIVASVSDGAAAVAAVRSTQPDLIVLDIDMPVLDGLQAAKQIRQEAPDTRIVFLTVHEGRRIFEAAQKIGCAGFVVKSRLVPDLTKAVEEATAGRCFASPGLALE
jgi:DNA-binding NarL/FixJ family response regulator